MDYVRLGGAGVEVSELCLGAWMFGTESPETAAEVVDEPTAHAVLDAAWSGGVNFFDTANVYGSGRSEQYIGSWLARREREDFVVASKVFFAMRGRQEVGYSRKIIRSEIDGTLERLGTDYLDVYYIHGWHAGSPLEEALVALDGVVRQGKVHYLGVSNFAAWQVVEAQAICRRLGLVPISVVQPRYNAADHFPYTVDPVEMPLPDLFDACRYHDIAVCPYAPLAGGFLTGKYERRADGTVVKPERSRATMSARYGPFPDRWWAVLEAVREVASELDALPAQVAIRWAQTIAGLTSIPIVGATSVPQVEQTLGAADLSLTERQHRRITDAGSFPELHSHVYLYTD